MTGLISPPRARVDYAIPHSLWDSVILFPPIHEVWGALRWLGLRDRLRCPECRAVGTWKPHGTLYERLRHHDRPARRWLCKWCGYYVGPEGTLRAFPDRVRGHWALPRAFDAESPRELGDTPADVMKAALGNTWPWAG